MKKDERVNGSVEGEITSRRKVSDRLTRHLSSALRQQAEMEGIVRSFERAQAAFRDAMNPIHASLTAWRNTVLWGNVQWGAISGFEKIARDVGNFRRQIQASIGPTIQLLQHAFEQLPPKTQQALLLMGEYGWYLDMDMPLPFLWELNELLESGNAEEAEERLERYYAERLDSIELSIVEIYPQRARIINSAFSAHRRGEYELSIPVFLAQADGICKEVVDEHLFMKVKKKPRTAVYVGRIAADSLQAAVLSPLAESLPIGASEGERGPDFAGLNRHMVLHGESVDYGTMRNGLKAVSLVNYVAHVLNSDI